ncbi:helix-turn-helix domain-containing protein [Mycobacterium intracellulare]|uniref:helix-turn-helix domain-containing protein n=1 Tax=Mycobacterium intracellulare TaxID=1767 RepID=UPI001CDB1191|nr:helix-turn-helix domain-containing protein [Mycobacterium intracellulare]MCA2255833.1 helix-turn-helix domain-containing protein [Mycobacterium intracellulare]
MAQTEELLNVAEVADLMGVKLGTVYSMRSEGRGPMSFRRGKRLVYRRSDVETFLAREREDTMRGEGVVPA